MGTSSSQSLKLKMILAEQLHEVFSRAIREHHTHEYIMEHVLIVLANKKLPRHAKEYLQGICDTMRWTIYSHHLIWLKMLDGELRTTEEVEALTIRESVAAYTVGYRSPWARVDSDQSRHVWKDEHGQPLRDKPYDAKFR